MPGFEGQVLWCANQNFSDPTGSAFHHLGEFLAAGDIAIGTGVAAPGQQIAVGHLVGAGGITITNTAPNITIDGSGVGSSTTYNGNSGSATPAAGILNVLGAGTVNVTGAGNTLTITGTGGGSGLTWNNISASQTMSVNNGYFCSGGAAIALLLPPVSAFGDTIEIVLDGSSSVTLTQGAGQTIKLANAITTVGVGGSLASTQQGDSIRLLCKTINLAWTALSVDGSWTIV